MRLFLTISDRISGGVATKPVNRDIPNGRSSRPNCVIWAGCRRCLLYTSIDTGGIEPDSGDIILSQMREQAQIAIDTADVILFMVDVKQGLVDADSKVADMLRRSHKPVVLVVNKVDSFQKYMADVYEFYNCLLYTSRCV